VRESCNLSFFYHNNRGDIIQIFATVDRGFPIFLFYQFHLEILSYLNAGERDVSCDLEAVGGDGLCGGDHQARHHIPGPVNPPGHQGAAAATCSYSESITDKYRLGRICTTNF
jgi:hypothetical protein